MKILFITTLVLNLLLEGLAAAALIGGANGITKIQPATGMWEMNYGFAAIAIASAIFWVWPRRTSLAATGAVLGILLTFHIALFISLGLAGTPMGGIVGHGILAVLCGIALTQRSAWCTEP